MTWTIAPAHPKIEARTASPVRNGETLGRDRTEVEKTDVPSYIDPETWLPTDWLSAPECAKCGCSKPSHVGAWSRERGTYCVYGGRHRDLVCRRYVASQPTLGL